MTDRPILCLGETLWDVLPSGEFLGGAPLNVSAHVTKLGMPAVMISRVGADDRGRRTLDRLKALHLRTDRVQIDPVLPTGEARATLKADGAAEYTFTHPAAWDAIALTSHDQELAQHSSAVVFGTLAQRTEVSRQTIYQLVDSASWRILDVNLRAPHDDLSLLMESLTRADFVKVNETELAILADALAVDAQPESVRAKLFQRFGTGSLCITLGAEGALLYHDGGWVEQAAFPTQVADTVGAGDSFLARLLVGLLHGQSPAKAMQQAARLAAFVASQHGAIPDYDGQDFAG